MIIVIYLYVLFMIYDFIFFDFIQYPASFSFIPAFILKWFIWLVFYSHFDIIWQLSFLPALFYTSLNDLILSFIFVLFIYRCSLYKNELSAHSWLLLFLKLIVCQSVSSWFLLIYVCYLSFNLQLYLLIILSAYSLLFKQQLCPFK